MHVYISVRLVVLSGSALCGKRKKPQLWSVDSYSGLLVVIVRQSQRVIMCLDQ